jgi:aspartate/methionine/tyrosine aminotransferase
MLTPEGQAAGKMDKIMLLAMWANHLRKAKATEEREVIIAAGMGRPTYPLNAHTREFLANFWSTHSGEAIGYGHPQGDIEARRLMASAMSSWYANPINDNNILFTVGGAGSLKSIFAALKTIHADTPNFRVITPFPYYTLYADNGLKLHPIDVMQNTGYRLTAESLRKSLESAHQLAKTDRGEPRAFLLCDPSNPLGTVLGREELEKIAIVLREYPKLNIILDEAYAEMVLDGEKHVSLLTVAPDLKDRIIIMRSATKGLSAAGERMAITMAFDDKIMSTILKNSISTYGHAPRSLQIAYAETMSK